MGRELTPKQIVEERLLPCSLSKIYDLFRRGELRGYRCDDIIVIYEDSIQEFKERHANPEPKPPPPAVSPILQDISPRPRGRPPKLPHPRLQVRPPSRRPPDDQPQ
jgi:hypothetical protein